MIRVIRVLEYTYTDQAAFEEDQARWQLGISKVSRPNPSVTIRSAMLPPQTVTGTEPPYARPDADDLKDTVATAIRHNDLSVIYELFGFKP